MSKQYTLDNDGLQARIFIEEMLQGKIEQKDVVPDNLGSWQPLCNALFEKYQMGLEHGGQAGAIEIIRGTIQRLCRKDSALDTLMKLPFNASEHIEWNSETLLLNKLIDSALNGGHHLVALDTLVDALPTLNAVTRPILEARLLHGKDAANAAYRKQIETMPYLKTIVENVPTFDDDVQDITSMPPLPDALLLSDELISSGCTWLDDYEQFSKKWEPRAYDLYHTCGGLFVLSTLAGRRVQLNFGDRGVFTQLYITQIGKSGSSKSGASHIAKLVLKEAGLKHRLTPQKMTPQSFLQELAGRVHLDYDNLDSIKRGYEERDYSTSGQRGWIFDELGGHLEAILQANGYMGAFDELFRVFEECETEYKNTTIGRGADAVEYPYIAVLGNMTFADIKNLGNKTQKLWGNGYFARFLFAVAPREWFRDDEYPRGKCIVPDTILRPLQVWDKRLGVPTVTAKTGIKKGETVFERTPLPVHESDISEDIREAFYRYEKWLKKQAAQPHMEQLASNYVRLAHKTLSIALLFASLDNGGCIEMRHYAKAQDIIEKMRASLHELVVAVQESGASATPQYEDEALRTVRKNGEANASTLRQNSRFFKNKDIETATNALTMLEKAGILASVKNKRGWYEVARQE